MPAPASGPADRAGILDRIRRGLEAAGEVLAEFTPGSIESQRKKRGDPVTAADLAVNDCLHRLLPRAGDGWLSEETADDLSRLERASLWAVDPIDGTKEFVMGLPEWCVSIGFIEDGEAVAGGLYNRAAGQMIVGAVGEGVWINGEPARARSTSSLQGAVVLASRSEVKRGQWERFAAAEFAVQALGSVAWKLGLVAAGLADATWTLVPKHEWDVAAGVALVRAAGGDAKTLSWERPRFNKQELLFDGLVASAPGLLEPIRRYLSLPAHREP